MRRDQPACEAVTLALLLSLAAVFAVGRDGRAAGAPAGRTPIYDESADAKKQVDDAVARAAKDNKRVLLQIGGNWCGWCWKLHDLCTGDKAIAKVLRDEYEVVHLNVSPGKENKEILAAYDIRPQGYPYLAVLDGNNKLVTQQETSSLEDGPKHDPAKVLAFLEKWKPQSLDAQAALAAALKQAADENKRVFLRFGAPWCGWCHRLDALVARPAVNDALSADFVILKVDTDRMAHGKEVQKKYQTGGGIPWYAILSPDGKVLGTSDIRPGSNIGYPTEPQEVEYLVKLFTGERTHMTEAQAKAFAEQLTSAAADAKAGLKH